MLLTLPSGRYCPHVSLSTKTTSDQKSEKFISFWLFLISLSLLRLPWNLSLSWISKLNLYFVWNLPFHGMELFYRYCCSFLRCFTLYYDPIVLLLTNNKTIPSWSMSFTIFKKLSVQLLSPQEQHVWHWVLLSLLSWWRCPVLFLSIRKQILYLRF